MLKASSSLMLLIATVVLCLLVTSPAEAACPTTLSVGAPDALGNVLVTAGLNTTCGGSWIQLLLDGREFYRDFCPVNTCTVEVNIDTHCLSSGTHTIVAVGVCGAFGSGCPGERSEVTSGLSVNNTPTVSLSMGPVDASWQTTATVTVHYQTAAIFRTRYLLLFMNGQQIARYNDVNPQDFTWTVPVNLACKTGPFKFKAIATTCGMDYGASLPENQISPYPADPTLIAESAEVTVDATGTPSASLAIPEPDFAGQTTATVSGTFPYRVPYRYLRLFRDGDIQNIVQEEAVPGNVDTFTFTTDLNFACTSGTKRYRAAALVCGQPTPASAHVPPDEKFIGLSSEVTMTDQSDPSLSVTYTTDIDGNDIGTVAYTFPSTDRPEHRDLAIYIDGTLVRQMVADASAGTEPVPLPRCWSELKAVATACDHFGEPSFTDEKSVQAPSAEPTISVTPSKVKGQPGRIRLLVQYDLKRIGGTVRLELAEYQTADGLTYVGQLIEERQLTDRSGTYTVEFTPPYVARQVHIVATAQSCEVAKEDVWVECDACDATANPVFYSDGNMLLTDSDPLPPIAGHRLIRTYNSDDQIVGLFGRGWTTLFDQRLIADSTGAVTIASESSGVVTFRNDGTGWRQTWPTAAGAYGTLIYSAGTGTYAYRAAGLSELKIFRASDGKLVELRDLTTGHGAQLSYSANGLPESLTDNWTTATWLLTFSGRSVSSISVAGMPDLTWAYQYDGNGKLTTVQAPGSHVWRTYEYVADRMTASRGPLGNLIESHDYDADGFATNSTGDVDEIASIEYELVGSMPNEKITRVTYKTGAISTRTLRPIGGAYRVVQVSGGCASCGSGDATYVRDEDGRVILAQDASGYVTSRAYEGDKLVTEIRFLKIPGCDPETDSTRCRVTTDVLSTTPLEATPATITRHYAYTDAAWPEKLTATTTPSILNPVNLTSQATIYHPALGVVLSTTSSGWSGTTPVQETRTTTHQPYGDVPPCDAQGNGCTTADAYAPAFDPGGNFSSSWLSLPQPAGMLRSTDGPRTDVADVTRYVYYPIDAAVPAMLRGRLAAVKNAAGHMMRFEAYDVFGNAIRTVDANGVATETTHDSLGRVLTSTVKGMPGCDTASDPLCATDLTTRSEYASTSGPLEEVEQPGGGVTIYSYDLRGRVAVIARGPNANDLKERTETSYDAVTGKKSQERRLAFEGGTWVEKTRESSTYDTNARLSGVIHADGNVARYWYDAADRITSVQDENHGAPNVSYAYDAAGRLVSLRQTVTGVAGGEIATNYGYDLYGNLAAVTDPNGNLTTYVFDDFGQMLSQSSPSTGVTTYAYGLAGELLTTRDANGASTTRLYDELGRIASATSMRSGVPTEEVHWQYDDATAGRFGIGRLTQLSDPTGVTRYDYERKGSLRREERTFVGLTGSYVTRYTYDANGNRAGLTYPSDIKITYSFDYAGRPISAAAVSGAYAAPIITAATYLPFGPPTSLTFGNGTVQTMAYDNRYRMAQNRLTSAGTPMAQYDYSYDSAGNVIGIADGLDSSYNRTFAYDDLNRLVTANTGTSLWLTGSYSYDAMGNMLALRLGEIRRPPEPGDQTRLRPRTDVTTLPLGRVSTFTYQGSTPKLASVTTNDLEHSVSYDSAGNEASYLVQRTYSARNLLASVIEDLEGTSHTITYGYDGRGLRVRRSEPPAGGGNSNRYFLYSPELQLLSITNDDEPNPWLRGPRVNTGAPSLRTQIIWFGGRPVAQVTDSELRFTFADHLGTPILQTTYTTPPEIQWRAEYEPFGNVYEMRQGNRIDQPLRFPGQEVAMSLEGQEENYNVFRWYRSGWGRYTQPDPLTMAGTALTELYTYAAANPVNSADPTGLVTVNQTFTRRGSLLGGGGNYTLAYSKVKATGTCVCSGGSNYIRLTLDFDHSYLCSGSACAIEQKHAEIASPFISRVAREWNQYEQVPYVSNAQCLADADYWAKDLERGILDGRRWPKDLLRRYNDAQNDYESTHHGWCATPGLPCAK